MKSLFKKPIKAVRVAIAEYLSKDTVSTMQVSRDQKTYTVALCLANKTKRTEFHAECLALDQMREYRNLYKETN